MGALYVKDDEAFRMAKELAERHGLTKTAAVKLALANELGRAKPKPTVREIVSELHRTSTLPPSDPNVVIDKAFWDSLNDEDDD